MQKENWWCHNLKLHARQAHILGWQLHFGLPHYMYQQCWILRTGGKGLKYTQVYPKGFGVKIRSLHETTMVQLASFL